MKIFQSGFLCQQLIKNKLKDYDLGLEVENSTTQQSERRPFKPQQLIKNEYTNIRFGWT